MNKIKKNKVNIIIPTYREKEGTIEKCIFEVVKQKKPQDEVIVVEDSESIAHERATSKFLGANVFPTRNKRTRGKAGALNSGILFSEGDIFVFLDADCIPEKEWLKNLLKPFDEDPSTLIVAGVCDFTSYPIWSLLEKASIIKGLGHGNYFVGRNFAVRRELAEKIGLFDEESIVEDIDYYERLSREGISIKLSPESIVKTQPYETFNSFLTLRKRIQVGTTFLLIKGIKSTIGLKEKIKQTLTFSSRYGTSFFFLGYPLLMALYHIPFWMYLGILWVSLFVYENSKYINWAFTAYVSTHDKQYFKLFFFIPLYVVIWHSVNLYALYFALRYRRISAGFIHDHMGGKARTREG